MEGYSQAEFYGIPGKKCQVICGTEAQDSDGCGTKWFNLEILEEKVLGKTGKRGRVIPGNPASSPDVYRGLVINGFSFYKQEGISAQVDRNPDNGGNSEIDLIDIQVD